MKSITFKNSNMNPYGNESVELYNDKVMKWGDKNKNEDESVWNFEEILEA